MVPTLQILSLSFAREEHSQIGSVDAVGNFESPVNTTRRLPGVETQGDVNVKTLRTKISFGDLVKMYPYIYILDLYIHFNW